MKKDFFPQRPNYNPTIYAYADNNPQYDGLLKVGYTTQDVKTRVEQQYPTKRPGKPPYSIVFQEPAIDVHGRFFSDHDVHRALKKAGVHNPDGEWFKCSLEQLQACYIAVKNCIEHEEHRTHDFKMRPEQDEAVRRTIEYFQSAKSEYPQNTPKFLWNAKMRFGKTFASYQLALKMGMQKILILTFKPAVENAWRDDLKSHIDFVGWQFLSREGLSYEDADKDKPMVCFGSFQDYLGVNTETKGIKVRNEWVHATHWDMVIFDEYHFGAWKENAKNLFIQEDEDSYDTLDLEKYDSANAYNEDFLPITTDYFLFLSGTPFRAINTGEFIEEQIYSWTYTDEQRAKVNWQGDNNPYEALSQVVLMTYQMPDDIKRIALEGEFDEFDLNVFFAANGQGEDAKFVYENEVQKWLNLIRGAHLETSKDNLKLGARKPPFPYADTRLLNVLNHTLWFLPNVAACFAMANLLKQKQNVFYHDYNINICAGTQAGIGVNALAPVLNNMLDAFKSKSITLSCGKLTTGVTVKPWTGILMLRNLSSPETYFQAAFRVQSPWVIQNDEGKKEVIKKVCYIFDFALDRALKQIAEYSYCLNLKTSNPEEKVNEIINFLPVLSYDGSTMKEINAGEVLDIATAGTSASLLARRWESALLVNVDNNTLQRLMDNEEVMEMLMKIEGFRSLNSDIETIINKSEAVKKAKKENESMDSSQKKAMTEAEKEYKSKRKLIQEKLIKFAARIPIFMYLTDYREYSLEDVISKLEPELFKKVTGLDKGDFDQLLSLGLFNKPLMNDAIIKFRRYENESLEYTGINMHTEDRIGLFDSTITIDRT